MSSYKVNEKDVPRCPCCGGHGEEVYGTLDGDKNGNRKRWAVVLCKDCGLLTEDTESRADAIDIWKKRIPVEKEVPDKKTGLLPCPCCGGRADGNEPILLDGGIVYEGAYVLCEKCGLITDKFRTYDEAKESWNRRAHI
jgi:uncharacterized Zn finger protein